MGRSLSRSAPGPPWPPGALPPQGHREEAKARALDFTPPVRAAGSRGGDRWHRGAAHADGDRDAGRQRSLTLWHASPDVRICTRALPKLWGSRRMASVRQSPMPCHRRIDEFFDGSGNWTMIGSFRDGTLGSGESRLMLEYVVPIKAPFESPQIRTLPLW
jgi:hypothetical protein